MNHGFFCIFEKKVVSLHVLLYAIADVSYF